MAWTTPGTATAGDVLTASFWNTQVRDNMIELAPFMTTFTSWTPTIAQNGTRTITNTNSKYVKIGRFVFGRVNVTITNAGTSGNLISCSYPVTPANYNDQACGTFFYGPTGNATRYTGTVILNSAGFLFQTHNVSNVLGILPSFATANGDFLTFEFTFESAS